MDYKDLMEEIRLTRMEVQNLQKEFYIFKGKALGFLGFASVFSSILVDYIKNKLH